MPYHSKKQIILFIAIFFVLSLFLASDAYAANWYVRQGATGSANGTDWINAYTSLPATLVRGDTYYVADGSYGGYTFDDVVSGTRLITVKKATIVDHGTSTGWDNTYGDGQAIFTGRLYFATSYWLLDGVTGGGPGNWGTGFGFKVIEETNNLSQIKVGEGGTTEFKCVGVTVKHIELQGKGSVSLNGGSQSNDGVAIHGQSDFTMSYAWMHGQGRAPIFGYSVGVTLFEYVWISEYYGSKAVHSEILSYFQWYVNDTTFRYNLVTDIQSTGGLMWSNLTNPSASMYVYGNIFYKIPGSRWSNAANGVIGGWSSQQTRNMKVYNNTFINIDYMVFTTFAGGGSGNVVYNNIFYNSVSPNYAIYPTHNYNHYINSGGTQSEANGTSAASGNPFVDYVNLNFALTSPTSAGLTLSSPTGITIDPLGTTRAVDGVWDIGAYEYLASAPIDITPPVRANSSPTGQLSADTTQTALSLTTNENAACKYSLTAGTAYSAMTNAFSTTSALNHSTNVSGLTNGSSYNYYIRCQDTAGNPNTTDFPVSFSIASGSSGNLLLNPDFEGGFTSNLANNWNITTDGSIGYSISQDTGYQGSAQKINISSPGSWGLLYYQTPSFQLNQFYNWSFWYKTEGIGSLWAQITNAPHTQVVHSESLPSTNGQWTYKTINFQYINSLANQLRFSSNATSSYWIDNIELAVALPSQDITPPSAPQNLSVN